MKKLTWENRQIIDSLEKVDGDNASMTSTTYKWISRFGSGRNEIEDELRSGTTSTSDFKENIGAVRDMM